MSSHSRQIDNKQAKEVKYILCQAMIKAMEKNTSGKGMRGQGVGGRGGAAVLNRVGRESLTEEVKFEQKN